MTRQFCYICGGKLSKPEGRSWWCKTCQQRYFDNPRPATDVILLNEKNEVLLVKRAFDPGKGKWDIPGGFVESQETFEGAIRRELQEELGLKPEQYKNLTYSSNYPVKYPWGKETYDIVAVNFTAQIQSTTSLHPDDDVADYKYIKLSQLDSVDFSFPPHKQLILEAASRLGISS